MALGRSLYVHIPKDFARGKEIEAGDELEISYNGHIEVRTQEEPDE